MKTHAQGLVGWIAVTVDDTTIGHIFMQEEPNEKIKFLDAWVHEDHRRKGIFRSLWETRWKFVQQNYLGWKAYAWALPMSLPLLLEKGFNKGDMCVYVEKNIHEDEVPFTFVSC